MRAILLILIVVVVALIAAVSTGYLDISQTREARVPSIAAAECKIQASGGQSPAFEVQTGSVQLGTREANVSLPKVEVKRDAKGVAVPVVEVRPPEEAQQNAAR